mgnify:CR=1 FL=1
MTNSNLMIDSVDTNEKSKTPDKNTDCIELKNIQYKTMLEKGNDNFIVPNVHNFQNLSSVETILDKERENYKLESWNKLNNTIKRQKIINFVDNYISTNNLSVIDKQNMLNSIFKYLDKNMLQKTKDVDYDKDNGIILDIPALEYNTLNKRFTLKKNIKTASSIKSTKTRKKTDKTNK